MLSTCAAMVTARSRLCYLLAHRSSIAVLQVGQNVDFQMTDPVWIGNAIAISRDAFLIGQIEDRSCASALECLPIVPSDKSFRSTYWTDPASPSLANRAATLGPNRDRDRLT
jgi:hypothetical protein